MTAAAGFDRDVVEERGEPFLLPLPCGLPYALQRLCHTFPVLRPAHALLDRVLLGLRPSLRRRLRCRSPGFVRQLPCSTMTEFDFPRPCHYRFLLFAFPIRASSAGLMPLAGREISQVPTLFLSVVM